jgi:hypothetical protein
LVVTIRGDFKGIFWYLNGVDRLWWPPTDTGDLSTPQMICTEKTVYFFEMGNKHCDVAWIVSSRANWLRKKKSFSVFDNVAYAVAAEWLHSHENICAVLP